MEYSDHDLIVSYLAGDEESLKVLFGRYTNDIYNYARRMGGLDDASDITSEVFIKVWKNLKNFNVKKAGFKTWIFMIARRTIIDYLRKRKNIPLSYLDNEEVGTSYSDSISDDQPLPDIAFDKEIDVKTLNTILESISPPHREVLTLYYQEDMTFDEIGKVLDKSINTVKSQHRRALISLREKYQDLSK